MEIEGESIVKINIRRHDVTIKDGIEVHVKHKKTCVNPCSETEYIVNYLQDEMFLRVGFFVTSNQDY